MWRVGAVFAATALGSFVLLRGVPSRGGGRSRASPGDLAAASGGAMLPALACALERVAARLPAARAWLSRLREHARERELARLCEGQVPELLDILALGLSAGLSFDASVELYGARSDSALARELVGALNSWRLGLEGRAAALERLARRTASPSLGRFAAAVAESLAFGSPLASVLERQAEVIREEQRSRTRQRVEEVPVRMLVPLGTLVVPAMLLAVVGPLVIAAFS